VWPVIDDSENKPKFEVLVTTAVLLVPECRTLDVI